ncbi:MAG: 1-deoxy-D-xylulose-5-phosphate synthase [Calditrichaeota bacterium]|nr:1-deoxy-D-xylulose-5-phosphate synthase [Calditrichota bacterium]
MYNYLSKVNYPSDIRSLSIDELCALANECRDFLVDRMSKTSGHFASSLGVVELTVALHYLYNTPDDLIVWDVGHQAYIHKLLTGRKERFHTLRLYKGMSGFPKRSESEYDTFGVGHASTSISAAYGMVCANHHLGKTNKVVAVIGDGALTGGLAFEGLNNAGADDKDFMVILNDNDMSIDDNVGALNKYLTDITTSKSYNRLKDEVWQWANKHKGIGQHIKKLGHKIEEGVISTITPGAFFEQMGFSYIGPVDGHDLPRLVKILGKAKELPGPVLVHMITKKGKGYAFAESDALKYHAVAAPFTPKEGYDKPVSKKTAYTQIFASALEQLMDKDEKIIPVTPAMISGSGLKAISKKYPERLYDVGIAEGHSITFAAGLATQKGILPVAAIYSSFLQRAYDNLIHDVALQDLHVVFALDRGGVVGADGATHHGCFDISYLRCVPNMTIMVPGHPQDVNDMLYTALYHLDTPVSIRYPRDSVELKGKLDHFNQLEIGKAELIQEGHDVAILAIGTMLDESLKALPLLSDKSIHPAIYNMRFVKPLDHELLDQLLKEFKYIVTVEEGSLAGGFGSAVLEYLSETDSLHDLKIRRIGIPDKFVDHGSRTELFEEMKIDFKSIAEAVDQLIHNTAYIS